MGNSALKAHLETSQKTGVFQLTGKGLTEVIIFNTQMHLAGAFSWVIDTYVFVYTVSRGTTEAHWKPAHGRSVQQQNRGPS